jgi:hypothetical protein
MNDLTDLTPYELEHPLRRLTRPEPHQLELALVHDAPINLTIPGSVSLVHLSQALAPLGLVIDAHRSTANATHIVYAKTERRAMARRFLDNLKEMLK